MWVAGIRAIGGDVELIEVEEPRPLDADEVLIDVVAAGVGNWDDIVRSGGWDVGARPPMALGVEAAGTVAAVGSAVRGWVPGQAVMTHPLPLRDQGCWARQLIAPASLLAGKATEVSWEVAAAFPVPALTAWQVASDVLKLHAGEQLLVNGASGVTGSLVVALGALLGAEIIATAGSANRERVESLGASHVLDYHDPDWPSRVRQLTSGRGVDAAANVVRGGASVAIRAVADGGRLATITSDPPSDERSITVANVYVRPDGSQLRELAAHLANGRLRLVVAASYPLASARDALADAAGGHSAGAIVLTM